MKSRSFRQEVPARPAEGATGGIGLSSHETAALPQRKGLAVTRWATPAAKIAVSGGLLWLLFSRIDVAHMVGAARRSSPVWLVVALGAYVVAVLTASWRWHRLLRIQHVSMSLRAVTSSFVVALFFNNFLPTNIGGDVMRIRDTAGPAGSNARAATVVIADRIIGLLALVIFAAIGGVASANGRLAVPNGWIWGLLVAGVAGSACVLLIPARLNQWLRPLTRVMGRWVSTQIDTLVHSVLAFRASPGGLLISFAAALVVQASNIAVYAAVARALGVPVGLWEMAVIVPLSGLLQIVPVSINGFGVREAAFTAFFARLGLPGELALLVSLESTALIMAVSLVGAALYVTRHATDGATIEPVIVSS
jgi:glycosyltransferase 2 family protein